VRVHGSVGPVRHARQSSLRRRRSPPTWGRPDDPEDVLVRVARCAIVPGP
jgi:hypothetical protein